MGAKSHKSQMIIIRYGITPARGDIADTNIHVHCLCICLSVMTHNPARLVTTYVDSTSRIPCSVRWELGISECEWEFGCHMK